MSHHLRLVWDWVSYSFISKSFVESFTFLHFFLEVMILYPSCLLCHFTSPTRLRAIEGACNFPMNHSSSYEEFLTATLTCRLPDSAFCKYRLAVLGFSTWWTSRAGFLSWYSGNLLASSFGFLFLAESLCLLRPSCLTSVAASVPKRSAHLCFGPLSRHWLYQLFGWGHWWSEWRTLPVHDQLWHG